jgi:hypothetical protein
VSLLLLFNDPRDPRHLELLALARQLRDEERTDLAVVAAQTACEVYAEVAISEMLRGRELGKFEEVIPELLTGYSLMDRRGQLVFEALTGHKIQQASIWPAYRAHVELRNRVVHRGDEVTTEQAIGSVKTAEAFHEYIAAAWDATATGKNPGLGHEEPSTGGVDD